jgi:hypothetical protein
MTRLPIEPLLKVLPSEWRQTHHKSIATWQRIGLTVFHADRLCCKFGYHPWTIYGDLWFQEIWESNEQTKTKRHTSRESGSGVPET